MDTDTESGAGASSPHLDEAEQGQAAQHAALRPLVVHEIVREEGETALSRPAGSLFFSGLAAGLSMGFSFVTQALLRAGLADVPWARLVDSFGYSMGFLIVILGRQQLFTESTLTAALPALTRRDRRTLMATLRLWAIVLVANLLGTWIFAALALPEGLFAPEVRAALAALARQSVEGSFAGTFLRALFAGWLIATMVWLLPSSHGSRLSTVLLLTYVVGLGHLSHVIAGSVEAAYAVLSGAAPVGAYFGGFLAPTLLGNTVGGVSLVAVLNHAAIAPELEPGGARH